ncbi:methyltransferase domain-containing protein [Thermodesulfobacteriota bacterium]
MKTLRRTILDIELNNSIRLMKGRVIDIGGRKVGKRGDFRPPLEQIRSWEYLNSDPSSEPDYCCAADSIPLESGSVDTVIITEVLEYLHDPAAVLEEIFRVLFHEGICIASVPLLVPVHGDFWDDRQRFTSLKLKEMFQNTGFTEIDIRPMGSLGSVLTDTLHVAFSYAGEGYNRLYRLLYILNRLSRPFFIFIDYLTEPLCKYITTGYFITAKKISRTSNNSSS